MEAAKDVAKSVEGCVTTCKDVSRDEPSLRELGSSAQDVTRALNDLLNHVKDGHTDKIPDIMEVCEKLCFSFSVKSISRIFVSVFSLFEINFTKNLQHMIHIELLFDEKFNSNILFYIANYGCKWRTHCKL